MIGEVETERDNVMAGTVADQRIALLRQVKGIGPVAATVLGREVFHRKFTNRRELASYLGLTPARGRVVRFSSTRASARRATPERARS